MARYTCFNCGTERGTDNMVAACAACYDSLRAEKAKNSPHFCDLKLMARAEKAEASLAARDKAIDEATDLLDGQHEYEDCHCTATHDKTCLECRRYKPGYRCQVQRAFALLSLTPTPQGGNDGL